MISCTTASLKNSNNYHIIAAIMPSIFDQLKKAKKQTAKKHARLPHPEKPTTPPKENYVWCFDGTTRSWYQREKKVAKSPKAVNEPAPLAEQHMIKQAVSQTTATGLITPPSSLEETIKKVVKKSAPVLFRKAPSHRPNANSQLSTIDGGLRKVQGAQVKKISQQAFKEVTKHTQIGKPSYTTATMRITELYEVDKEKKEGFEEKLKKQLEKQKIQKEIDELFE